MKVLLCIFNQNRTFALRCMGIMEGFIQLKIVRLAYLRKDTRGALLTLQELSGERQFSFVIGIEEATSIATSMRNLSLPVILTHDLMHNIMTDFGLSVRNIMIHTLENGIFHTTLDIVQDETVRRVSARISDAVAMALRFNKPIFMNNMLFESICSNTSTSSSMTEEKVDIGPETDLRSYSVEQLNAFLASSVEHEEYEQAILVRDELNRRNRPQTKN